MSEATEADIQRLIKEAVHAADYGLGRDGCPFCGWVPEHAPDCIAVVFGATGKDPEDESMVSTGAAIEP